MAFSKVNSNLTAQGYSATVTASLGATATAGNLLVAIFGTDSSGAATGPSGWTSMGSYTSGTHDTHVYYIASAAGTETSAALTTSGTSGHWRAWMAEYSYSGSLYVEPETTFGSDDDMTDASEDITTTYNNALLIASMFNGAWYFSGTATPAAPFTVVDQGFNHQGSMSVVHNIVTTTGDYGVHVRTEGSGTSCSYFAFSESGSGGGGGGATIPRHSINALQHGFSGHPIASLSGGLAA